MEHVHYISTLERIYHISLIGKETEETLRARMGEREREREGDSRTNTPHGHTHKKNENNVRDIKRNEENE